MLKNQLLGTCASNTFNLGRVRWMSSKQAAFFDKLFPDGVQFKSHQHYEQRVGFLHLYLVPHCLGVLGHIGVDRGGV